MRKVDPASVRHDFDAFASERRSHFVRLEGVLKGTPHEKRDLSILAETTLHSTYVAFEVFLSDLLLAYMNRDFSTYQATLQTDIQRLVQSKLGVGASSMTKLDAPKHIKIQHLENLVDPTGWNLTFKSVALLQTKFAAWVSPAHGAGVAGLVPSDTKLIDTARAIRNFTAHKSDGSKQIMNNMLLTVSTGACPNSSLLRGNHEIHDVGAYLKSASGGQRRVVTYIERLRSIAATL
ncbi:hypothetical protein [Hydrogenophaga sp.]|uniref:hypothetical protein n=1 Tax=Hydrogenophaga sp. TaxID=1904254 RepID=UPI002719E83F|nr:hypothetical protein [Hydrogenophaga sp.]MDO9504250.1 hypothetical protein [Hydrogenophaga sp.]